MAVDERIAAIRRRAEAHYRSHDDRYDLCCDDIGALLADRDEFVRRLAKAEALLREIADRCADLSLPDCTNRAHLLARRYFEEVKGNDSL